jgi:hypothetical protein
MVQEMMQEMMNHCCADDCKPDLNKMKAFMEKWGKQDFSEEEHAMMCQTTRFYLENHFCDPEGRPDAKQMKQLFGNCGCSCGL